MSIARKNSPFTSGTRLSFETLESRAVPDGNPCVTEIGGRVYADCNGNGQFDAGDTPLANVTLTLSVMNTENTFVASTTTDASGLYKFVIAAPSPSPYGFMITETQPAGYEDGPDYVGTINGVHVGSLLGPDRIKNITIQPCQIGLEYNFTEKCPPSEETGRQGLTPGFWKNNATRHGASAWADTGYTTGQTLGSVFNFAGTAFAAYANTSLVDALGLNGGGVNALLRHAVAGLLNAGHTAVDYALTTQQIVAQVNEALANGGTAVIEALKNELDGYNNLGANLNQHGLPT